MPPKPVLFTVVGVSFSGPRLAFDTIVPRDDSTLFTGYLGVLPAVVSAENHGESYSAAGDSRTVLLSDGGSFREEIVRYVRPPAHAEVGGPSSAAAGSGDVTAPGVGHFDYDVTRFTGILNRIVVDAEARWTYAPGTTGRTRITWSYAYRPLPGRTFLVRHIIGPLWMRYMSRSMKAVLAAIVAARVSESAEPADSSEPSQPAEPPESPETADPIDRA